MVTSPDSQIADKISIHQKNLGISDVALAEATGIPRSTLRTKIKNGDMFTVSELRRVSAALGVATTHWFVGREAA